MEHIQTKLSISELKTLRGLVLGVRGLRDLDAESVGRIADYVGEFGFDDLTVLEDSVVVEVLRIVVDAMNKR